MKTHSNLIISLIVLTLCAILIAAPSSTRAALEHNLWSVAAAEAAFGRGQAPTPRPAAHPHAYQWLARLALLQGDIQEAFNWLSFLGEWRDPYTLNTLAQAYYQDVQPLFAFELWQEIGFTSQLVKAAKAAQDAGDIDLAAQAYRFAYAVDPERFTIELARLLQQHNNIQEAETLLERALDTYPLSDDRTSWWRLLGELRRDVGDAEGEETAYRSALIDDPSDYNAWISLGWLVYNKSGDVETAIAYFSEAIRAAPTRSEGFLAIGRIWMREEQPEKAIEWYRKASERYPGGLNLGLTYANLLSDTGQFNLALIEYERVMETHPDSWWPYYHIATAFWDHDDPDQAIQAIETAALLNPNDVRIFNRAGWMYEELGRLDDALAAFQQALIVSPNNSTAQRGVNRLTGGE